MVKSKPINKIQFEIMICRNTKLKRNLRIPHFNNLNTECSKMIFNFQTLIRKKKYILNKNYYSKDIKLVEIHYLNKLKFYKYPNVEMLNGFRLVIIEINQVNLSLNIP